jgi:ribonuclease HI
MLTIFVDGSGKTGKYAFVVEGKNEVKIFQKSGITNNEAEYLSVIEALKAYPKDDLIIVSDSRLVVNQLQMQFAIKDEKLRKLAQLAWELMKGRKIIFKLVPREQNKAGKVLG